MQTFKDLPDLSFSFGGLKLGIDLYEAANKEQGIQGLWIVEAFDNKVPVSKIFEGFLVQVRANREMMTNCFGKDLVGRIEKYQSEKLNNNK